MMSYGIRPSGFRLPDDTALGHVSLQVSDLGRSIDYYTRVLGLQTADRGGRTARLATRDGRTLVELQTRPGVTPRRGAALGLYHFAVLLPDRPALGRFLRHLADLGPAAGRLGMADHFVSEALYLTDPDGLGIEVYADRPRSEWRQAGQELAMTTEPLDAASVIASAGSASWEGMPAGTVMGHVHLHVGDLERAAAFYHDGLGLDKVVWSYPGALFMSAGGYHHHLGTNTWSHGAPPDAGDARLVAWTVNVPREEDAAAAAASLTGAGVAIEKRDGAFFAVDPWGTPLRISSNSPRTGDR